MPHLKKKLTLPNVTLLAVTSVEIEQHQIALKISSHNIEFGAVKLLSPSPPEKKYSDIEYNNTINEMNIVKIKNYIFNICRNQDKIYKGVGSKILEKFYNYLKKQNITEIYLCPQYKYFENYIQNFFLNYKKLVSF